MAVLSGNVGADLGGKPSENWKGLGTAESAARDHGPTGPPHQISPDGRIAEAVRSAPGRDTDFQACGKGKRRQRNIRRQLDRFVCISYKYSDILWEEWGGFRAASEAFPSQITSYFRAKETVFVQAACRDVLYSRAGAS